MVSRIHGLLIALLIAGTAIAGCGAKGDLYLPDNTQRQQRP